jgi:hypothetical protein
MCRALLAALALLVTISVAACGMRFSGSYFGSSSFTSPVPSLHSPIGSLSADVSHGDYTARSHSADLTLHSGLLAKDCELQALIFQDLDGDAQYSPGADRLLAKSDPAKRDPSANRLILDPIEFTFKPRHEPVGISWVLQSADGQIELESKMFR